MNQRPLCFVLMPFGRKTDTAGRMVDFDKVYYQLLKPGIEAAGLQPIRADEEKTSGIIHKDMFERLMLCDYAVVDVSSLNANVYYELGIRHALRPATTLMVGASGTSLPFDLINVRTFNYALNGQGLPADSESAAAGLAQFIKDLDEAQADSPVFQLIDLPPVDISRLKTDLFREKCDYDMRAEALLRSARLSGDPTKVQDAISQLGPSVLADAGVACDALLSLRAVSDWQGMLDLCEAVDITLSSSPLFQEQRSLALGRLGRYREAEALMQDLIGEHGLDSERAGILGRLYKEQWAKDPSGPAAAGYLQMAIDTYLGGFESDWRDAYPGINALSLMYCRDPKDQRISDLSPVVMYAVRKRLAGSPDFWDWSSTMELGVIAENQAQVEEGLVRALALQREGWESRSSADNLQMLQAARGRHGLGHLDWLERVIDDLRGAADRLDAKS